MFSNNRTMDSPGDPFFTDEEEEMFQNLIARLQSHPSIDLSSFLSLQNGINVQNIVPIDLDRPNSNMLYNDDENYLTFTTSAQERGFDFNRPTMFDVFDTTEYESAITAFMEANTGTLRSGLESVDKEICNIMIAEYFKSQRTVWPGVRDIVRIALMSPCRCQVRFTNSELTELYTYTVSVEGILPTCFEVDHMFLYRAQMGRFPTTDECLEFMQRMTEFGVDPEAYHQKDKVNVPAMRTDELPVMYLTEPETCTLCQEECTKDQLVVKLQPCGHVFHATAEECLETKSIYQWLDEHNYCFLCKTKIEIKN